MSDVNNNLRQLSSWGVDVVHRRGLFLSFLPRSRSNFYSSKNKKTPFSEFVHARFITFAISTDNDRVGHTFSKIDCVVSKNTVSALSHG
eukprot:m.97672 g.97672  ORF g.97672 m.97672 type:complete len:89 (+) comp27000_c0_seq1:63-329(+)